MAKQESNIHGQFVPLHHATLDSSAWRALSHGARSLYICLRRRVPRSGNEAFVSYRLAAKETGSSQRKIGEWFAELAHYRFIELTQHGCLGIDGKGKSPHWRLTECGTTSKRSSTGVFEPPTNDFLKWDGTRFDPTPHRCKKQNPASYGGSAPLPTGEAVVLPTGEAHKAQSASYGVGISSSPLGGEPEVSITTETTEEPQSVDARILRLEDWGLARQRKRFDEIGARFDALQDPRVQHHRVAQ